MTVDVFDRRVTRSLSNELQARSVGAAQSSFLRNFTNQNNNDFSSFNCSNSGFNLKGQDVVRIGLHHPQSEVFGVGEADFGLGADFQRNQSEEMFLRNLLDSSIQVPSIPDSDENIGFMEPQAPQPNRGNSEELFDSFLSNSFEHLGSSAQAIASGQRNRQNSRRMSSELAAIIAQQNESQLYQLPEGLEHIFQTPSFYCDDMMMGDTNQTPQRPGRFNESHGTEYSNSTVKAVSWFNADAPMTRSRSSELRHRYEEGQVQQPHHLLSSYSPSPASQQKHANHGTLELSQVMATMESFSCRNIGNSPLNMMSPLGPSSGQSPPGTIVQQTTTIPPKPGSTVSAVVSMLKGSLELKKIAATQQQQQHPPLLQQQLQGLRNSHTPQAQGRNFEEEAQRRVQQNEVATQNDGCTPNGGHASQIAYSPGESSGAGPALSTGLASSEGAANSAQTVSTSQPPPINCKRGGGSVDQPSPKRNKSGLEGDHSPPSHISHATGNGDLHFENSPKHNFPNKPGHLTRCLTRAGSITSSGRSSGFAPPLSDIDDATKKRRVERQRKMAEAKGRGNVPPMPADLQAAVKRCDALEKEVRSLKLNLSFMNRKDSEQTKRVEELEKQNEDLMEDKEKLYEELKRLTKNRPH